MENKYTNGMTKTRRYCVCNQDGMPLSEQGFSTITTAISRYNHEINTAMKLFNIDDREAQKLFIIKDMKINNTIL